MTTVVEAEHGAATTVNGVGCGCSDFLRSTMSMTGPVSCFTLFSRDGAVASRLLWWCGWCQGRGV